MTRTTTEGEVSERPENLAVGLFPIEIFSKVWFLALPHWNYSMIKGAGGIVSSVGDLHLWNESLSRKAQIEPGWSQEYFPSGAFDGENYINGWSKSERVLPDGKKLMTFNNGGEDPGYCAKVIRLEEAHAHLVLTTNSDYCMLHQDAYRQFVTAVLADLDSGAGFK